MPNNKPPYDAAADLLENVMMRRNYPPATHEKVEKWLASHVIYAKRKELRDQLKRTKKGTKPHWWPQLVNDPEYLAEFREHQPDDAEGMSDEELAEYLSEGWKYSDTWDHLGDARQGYEELADAFLKLCQALNLGPTDF